MVSLLRARATNSSSMASSQTECTSSLAPARSASLASRSSVAWTMRRIWAADVSSEAARKTPAMSSNGRFAPPRNQTFTASARSAVR
jgi:hypothetical protein